MQYKYGKINKPSHIKGKSGRLLISIKHDNGKITSHTIRVKYNIKRNIKNNSFHVKGLPIRGARPRKNRMARVVVCDIQNNKLILDSTFDKQDNFQPVDLLNQNITLKNKSNIVKGKIVKVCFFGGGSTCPGGNGNLPPIDE